MKLSFDITFYLGCFIMCVTVIVFILIINTIKKVVAKLENILCMLNNIDYRQRIIGDRLYNIENDTYNISRKSNKEEKD